MRAPAIWLPFIRVGGCGSARMASGGCRTLFGRQAEGCAVRSGMHPEGVLDAAMPTQCMCNYPCWAMVDHTGVAGARLRTGREVA